jgi:hypothetical protein
MTSGQTLYWRVRVQDGSGLWSTWSDAVAFTRMSRGALTITNPNATTPIVTEFTPPITWTYTGRTQQAYQVLITDWDDPTNVRYDSGRIRSTVTTHTLPKWDGNGDRVLKRDDTMYKVIVRVWDTLDREHTPGDRVYDDASRNFTFSETNTVATVTSLTTVQTTLFAPWINVQWVRSTAPDSFNIIRNGDVIESGVSPGEVLVSGTTYRYKDRDASPRRTHVYKVQAVVNGVTSSGNPTSTIKVTPGGIWVIEKDTDTEVFMANPVGQRDPGTWSMVDEGTTFTLPNATKPIRVTQSIGGWYGTINGLLIDGAGKTADEWQDNLLKIKGRPGSKVSILLGQEAFKAVIFNIATAPIEGTPTTRIASFDFFQVGDLKFKVKL